LSVTEKTIKQVIEDKFGDFTLEKMQAIGDGEYYNLNLSIDVEDVNPNLEFNRIDLAKKMSDFRQQFLSELSAYLPVVNVNIAAHSFTKNTNSLTFAATVLMSDTYNKDWVSGITKKTEKYKLKESKTILESEYILDDKEQKRISDEWLDFVSMYGVSPNPIPKNIYQTKTKQPYNPDIDGDLNEVSNETLKSSVKKSFDQGRYMKTQKFNNYLFKDFIGKELSFGKISNIELINDEDNVAFVINVVLNEGGSQKFSYQNHKYNLTEFKMTRRDAITLFKIAKIVDPNTEVKIQADFKIKGEHFHEAKKSQVFKTGEKDEFDVKDKLVKKGLKASVVKAKEVKVTWDDRKYNEDDIKKLVESDISKLKSILTKLYESCDLQEAQYEDVEIDPKISKKIDKTLEEYQRLTDELDRLTAEFNKKIEATSLAKTKAYDNVWSLMKDAEIEQYRTEKIIAQLSTAFDRTTTKYESVVSDLLETVNEETKKMINKLVKKYSSTTEVPSKLSIKKAKETKAKTKKESYTTEKVSLKENVLIDWFKNIYSSLFNYTSLLKKTRKKLERIAELVK